MIEFYGTLSVYTARQAERLRRRYYGRWIAALAALLAVCAVIVFFTSMQKLAFLVPLVCALVLAGAAAWLYWRPVRSPARAELRVVVDADAGKLTVVQYLSGKEVKNERPLARVRRVYKAPFCYYIVFRDLGSAVVCERSLLKKGTFDFFEYVFAEKLREKDFFPAKEDR